jgi:hypothetical protein
VEDGIILQGPRLEVVDLGVGRWGIGRTALFGGSTNMIETLGTREAIEVGIGMVGGIGMSEEAISEEDLRMVGRVRRHRLTHEEVGVVVEVVRGWSRVEIEAGRYSRVRPEILGSDQVEEV